MHARKALTNFHRFMVKLYGENYREVWTTDDRETAYILERRARKALNIEMIHANTDTPFLRRRFEMRTMETNVNPADRRKAWATYVNKYGSGFQGKLTGDGKRYSSIPTPVEFMHEEGDAYHGVIPIAGRDKSHAVVFKAPVGDSEPPNEFSAAWLMWKNRQNA